MLFKFKLEPEEGCLISNDDVLNFNNKLQSYGLFTFQHRLLNKILTFTHNIINNPNAPSGLKSILKPENINDIAISNLNQSLFVTELRSQRRIFKSDEKITKFNQLTFSYFFTKILHNFLNSNFNLPFFQFKKKILVETNANYCKFLKIFSKFNIEHRHYNFNAKKFKKIPKLGKKKKTQI